LIRTVLAIEPNPYNLRWLHDPFDNSVAVATFEGTTSELSFESIVTLEHFETWLPEYPLEEYARTYPFRYSDEDFPNLVRALTHHYPDKAVSEWGVAVSGRLGCDGYHESSSRHDAWHSRSIQVQPPN
jgi:hypothetical protein